MILNHKLSVSLALIFTALLCTSCSNVKSSLGLEKESPDEFAVITRAPLEVPPELILPTPQPGAPRPQEQSAIAQAESALLGDKTSTKTENASASESTMLQKAGAENAVPNIRSTVNQETSKLENRNKPVVQKLLDIGAKKKVPAATVVDAEKELERIRAKTESDDVITGEGSPSIDQ